MQQYTYLAMLLFVLVATLPLEFYLGVRVWRRPLRLSATLVPVMVIFLLWDGYAIRAGHWFFDPEQVTGLTMVGDVPLEEVLFFVLVPVAAIMTLEAVRVVRLWPIGDGLTPGRDVR